MTFVWIALILTLLSGCSALGDLGLWRDTGIVKDPDTIELPLAGVRNLEAAIYDRQMDLLDWKESICEASRKPGASCKLPARACAGLDDARNEIVETHRLARRILNNPDLAKVDGARIMELAIQALAAAAAASK